MNNCKQRKKIQYIKAEKSETKEKIAKTPRSKLSITFCSTSKKFHPYLPPIILSELTRTIN